MRESVSLCVVCFEGEGGSMFAFLGGGMHSVCFCDGGEERRCEPQAFTAKHLMLDQCLH